MPHAVRAGVVAVLVILPLLPTDARAAGWRLTCDARFRTVSFRGFELDSIPVSEVVAHPDGSLFTPDGIAVRIPPGSASAFFFRPGPELQSGPVDAAFDGVAWDLGVEGLSLHAAGRFSGNTGAATWPGTEPSVRLAEAYVAWANPRGAVRAGRMHELSRLGFLGYDGAFGELRLGGGRAALATYGGWGLARGDDLPATSAVLDPLEDFRPQERQLVLGVNGRGRVSAAEIAAVYQREVDPRAEDFVSERAGAQAVVGLRRYALSAGADYDIAMGSWGRAEANAAVRGARASAEVGWRRYAPYFPLWTIWGAFSPTPYDAWSGMARVSLPHRFEVSAGGEQWTFDDTGASTPLVDVEDRGWRWSAGLRWAAPRAADVSARLWQEYGPGASSLGYEASVASPVPHDLTLAAAFSWLRRPLEYRYDESHVATWMLRMDWKPRARWRAGAEIQRVDEERDRPDAAAFDWGHWRFALSTTIELDSGTPPGVPAAVLRIPELVP